jgi:hypothetical protein
MRTLKHFFAGAQSKEETASAYLATLLEFHPVFRSRFLALAAVEPRLDGSLDWAVRVEDGRMNAGAVDVTLEWPREDPTTFVMIENKLAASAKRAGQLRKYYLGAVNKWPGRRIVGFYLAPSKGLGASEIREVRDTEEYRARGGERPSADDWFETSGIDEVLKAIAHPPLPPDEQRDVIRDIVNRALHDLANAVPGVAFFSWRSVGQEAVYKPGGMLTIFVTVAFPVDEEARLLRDVVVDDNVRVTLVTHFGLRTEAVKPPEVVGAWRELLRERRVDISGMDFEPTPNGRLQLVDEVQVSRAALQELIVKRATQVTTFLRERPELRAFD